MLVRQYGIRFHIGGGEYGGSTVRTVNGRPCIFILTDNTMRDIVLCVRRYGMDIQLKRGLLEVCVLETADVYLHGYFLYYNRSITQK